MLRLLGGLSVYFKYQDIKTDNAVFRLHNVFTTVLLLTCSLIITATQYVGQPIQCIVNGLPANVVNTFCWITSTFTMPDAFARENLDTKLVDVILKVSWMLFEIQRDVLMLARSVGYMPMYALSPVGKAVAHPGIANEYDSTQEKKYYTYYQWVCFVLFFQALMCYTPKFLWDAFEGGLLRTIVMGLNIGICDQNEKEKKKDAIIGYLIRHERLPEQCDWSAYQVTDETGARARLLNTMSWVQCFRGTIV
ncbi:Innexin inx1 [Papilio xuthus]|uniref:Innexin n=1 Tax=Papilio xuthus TaxID=66420 RepID=A0A194PQX0_PAPXU|nr:Innexin inx1 [Papilio xuthus]